MADLVKDITRNDVLDVFKSNPDAFINAYAVCEEINLPTVANNLDTIVRHLDFLRIAGTIRIVVQNPTSETEYVLAA